jgi:transcriptional regulator with XRE-family HTH domain
MSGGYSLRIQDANAKASKHKLGARLGRLCIAQDIPVAVVAKCTGVTRQTVYNWFCGTSVPQGTAVALIASYMASLESSAS